MAEANALALLTSSDGAGRRVLDNPAPVDFRDTPRLIAAAYDATNRWLAAQTSAIAA
jgi:hypothetical protein